MWRRLRSGRLHVLDSKTDAGVRDVTLLPVLRDELVLHRAGSRFTRADGFVFATRDGDRCDDNHLRIRVLGKAIERANEHRAGVGSPAAA